MFPIEKYKFYVDSKAQPTTVYAVSTYGGKTVRGVAKCDPRDSFDLEKGKRLAAARCELKVAQKRRARAEKKFANLAAQVEKAENEYYECGDYVYDARYAEREAEVALENLLDMM